MIRVDERVALIEESRFKWLGVYFKVNQLFCDLYIYRVTIPHTFMASDHTANARVVFIFYVMKADVIFCCRSFLIAHVTICRISEVPVEERCI